MADVDRIAAALRYQQEMDAAQRPATMNPNIAAQGEVSRNRIAAALANQPPSWSGESLPMEGRATFLPFRDTISGSVMNKRELALPGMVAGAVNAFTAPARSMQSFVDEDGTVTSNFNAPEEAVNVAMNMMGGGIGTSRVAPIPNGSLGMNVYHGTPHRFPPTAKNPLGEFDATKIGTGEGAQAYGHGLYLAENPGVAKGYQENVTRKLFDTNSILGWGEGRVQLNPGDSGMLFKYARGTLPPIEAAKKLKINAGSAGAYSDETIADAITKIREQTKGNLYKVDLPDEHIDKMLDWDKPLSQQHPDVQAALSKTKNKQLRAMVDYASSPYSTPGLEGEVKTMGEAIKLLGMNANPAKGSQLLAKEGIPGIKYLDQGSRGASTGTRNFVVFPGNEGLLNILGRE